MTKVDIAVTIAPTEGLSQSTIDDLVQYQDAIQIIELRIDQWRNFDKTHLARVLDHLYRLHLGKKVLVTYRTASQGGEGVLSYEDYLHTLSEIATMKCIDMLDIEFDKMKDTQPLQNLINQAHNNQIKVVLSHHNFKKTPTLEDLKHLYFKMHQLEPDYLKVAVMPHDKQDVLKLLEAMAETADAVSQKVVGIAMSKLGIVSRTAQGLFGGSISYGCLDSPKAPGQIHVRMLQQQLDIYE